MYVSSINGNGGSYIPKLRLEPNDALRLRLLFMHLGQQLRDIRNDLHTHCKGMPDLSRQFSPKEQNKAVRKQCHIQATDSWHASSGGFAFKHLSAFLQHAVSLLYDNLRERAYVLCSATT